MAMASAMASILAALVVGALGAGAGAGSGAEYADFDAWMAEAAREMRQGRTPEVHSSGFSYKHRCLDSCGANDVWMRAKLERFELSSAARPTREFWNEEAVLRAMHSESEEPSFEDFYNRGEPLEGPLPVPRYSLDELGGWEGGRMASLLRAGVPVVVTDAHRSFPNFFRYRWTCEDFQRRFSGYGSRIDALYGAAGDTLEDQPFSDFFELLGAGSTLYWAAKMHGRDADLFKALLGTATGFAGLPGDGRAVCSAAYTPEFWFQRTADDRAPEAARWPPPAGDSAGAWGTSL